MYLKYIIIYKYMVLVPKLMNFKQDGIFHAYDLIIS